MDHWKRVSPGRLPSILGRLNFRRIGEYSALIRWLDPRPDERILDIGAGDGYYDWQIAKSGAQITGIDVHEKRLAAARRYYQGARTEFFFMDASKLDFPDASFDKAISLCVMEHLGDDDLVMRNISRALKPGGLFVFSADSLSNPEITPEERDRHRRRYAVNTFYTHRNVREKLARNGFDVLETGYLLSRRGDIRFVRLSWKLDELPGILKILKTVGYAALGTARKLSTLAPGRKSHSPEGGLTLLVKAVRRPSP